MRVDVRRVAWFAAVFLLLTAAAPLMADRWVPSVVVPAQARTAHHPPTAPGFRLAMNSRGKSGQRPQRFVPVARADKYPQAYLEQRLRESQRNLRWILWAVLALVVLLLVSMVTVMYRKRGSLKQVEDEKDAAMIAMQESQIELERFRASQKRKKTTPDLLLEGETPEGEMIAIKLAGELLGRKEGLIVGRNPAMSTYILDHPEVSRRHFRLVAVSDQLMIEDLGSTNGVSLDGQPIAANQLEVLMPGTEISLGDLTLYLRKAG